MIKPGFFRNEHLCALPFEARLCFGGLWLCSDREGRLEDRPIRLKADIFPYDTLDMNALIQLLHDERFVLRYQVGGEPYIQIMRFSRHQHPHHREQPSTIPSPPNELLESLRLAQGQALPRQGLARLDPVYGIQNTERDPSKILVGYTVGAPTNGNGHGVSLSKDPFLDQEITERAARFIERYETLYREHRYGARYVVNPTRDYAASVDLCRTWDDARLDRLAVIFLNSDHRFAEEGSRTIPQFRGLASWCDGKLAETEARK